MHDDDRGYDDDEIDIVSKSQIKREMQALQDLGKQLTDLNDSQLGKLPLGDKLLAAIEESRNIKQHIARKRHLKFIGKLLREEDEEAIRNGLDILLNQDKAATARFHRMEQWRDRLIGEGDGVLAEFINEYPGADRQQLRQLIRNAQKEAAANKPPKSFRQLFKLIRELMEQESQGGA
jgi:ribosome-associated protein